MIAILALASAACVSKGDGAVKVNPIEANLIFGAKPPASATPFPSDVQPDTVSDIAEELTLPPPIPGANLISRSPAKECPEAPLTAGVDTPADVNVTGPPRVGIARWKHSGHLTMNGKRVPFTGFERRVVRNFVQVTPTVSTFETLQPITTPQGTLFLESKFRVRTDGKEVQVNQPAGQGIPAPPSAREPDAGVVLTSLRTIDQSGSVIGTPFAPVTGILLLPLPVDAGDSWQSVAVDPKSGQTVIHNASIDRRQRIDACGDLVDGWYVISKQVIASGRDLEPNVAYNGYDYIIAPQFGGMIIDERFTQPDPTGDANPDGPTPSPFDLDHTLAQLNPDPLPAN